MQHRKRRFGERIRARYGAQGERTGGDVSGRTGTVVDWVREDHECGLERYFVRFGWEARVMFFDWLLAEDLLS